MQYINLHTYGGNRLAIRTDLIESVHEDPIRESVRAAHPVGGGTLIYLTTVDSSIMSQEPRRRTLAVKETFDVVLNTLCEFGGLS